MHSSPQFGFYLRFKRIVLLEWVMASVVVHIGKFVLHLTQSSFTNEPAWRSGKLEEPIFNDKLIMCVYFACIFSC